MDWVETGGGGSRREWSSGAEAEEQKRGRARKRVGTNTRHNKRIRDWEKTERAKIK